MDTQDENKSFTIGDIKVGSNENYDFQKNMDSLHIQHLNKKITILTILLLLLICAASIGMYIYFNKTINSFQNTGTVEIQNISKELETKLTGLSVEFAKLNYLTQEHIKLYNNSTSGLNDDISSTVTTLENIQSKIRVINNLDKRFAGLETKIKSLQTSLTNLKKDNKKTNRQIASLESKLTALGKASDKAIDKKIKQLVITSTDKIDKISIEFKKRVKELEKLSQDKLMLKLDKVEFTTKINELEKDLRRQLNSFESNSKRLNFIEKNFNSLIKAKGKSKINIQPKKKTTSENLQTTTSSEKILEVPTGKIIEKDIE